MKKYNVVWLSDEEYAKAIGQLRLQLNSVLLPFNAYGLDIFIPGAITEIIKLCEDFALRVRGVDKPINIDLIRSKK